MSRATPQIRDLAGRLIAEEISQQKPPLGIAPPPFHLVCEKLGPQLATLMGRGGYHALLSRALALSRKDADWLSAVRVNEAGALEAADEALEKVDLQELTLGSTLLVAELLGLLVAFIGDNLTLRLVRDVWPSLSLEDPNFTKRDTT